MSADTENGATEDVQLQHVFDPDKVPLKPILKHSTSRNLDINSVEITKQGGNSALEEGDPNSAGISWDEPTIAEHDKLRGTRTKITEPKTPFHLDCSGGSSDDERSALRGPSSMDIDKGSHEDSSSDSSPHHTKLSPRFALPPSHKKHHHGEAHHSNRHDPHAQESHNTDSFTSSAGVDDAVEAELGPEPGNRKIRSSVVPLDADHLEARVKAMKQQRDVDDAKEIPIGRGEDEESDSESSNEFLTPQERAKKAHFAEKRKQHYDEFKKMKELMKKQWDSDGSESSSESD